MKKIDLSLYLILTENYCLHNNDLDVLTQSLKAGVTLVQYRNKDLCDKDFFNKALSVLKICHEHKVPLIINDRVHIAQALNADGVHLGQNDLAPHQARGLIGPDKFLGLSVENMDQLKAAQSQDLDYLGLSPLFQTGTKKDILTCWQLDGLQSALKASTLPIIPIGGIELKNSKKILDLKPDGLAICSAICSAKNPYKESLAFKALLKNNQIQSKSKPRFKHQKMTEDKIIELFKKPLKFSKKLRGIGDDCAIVPFNQKNSYLFSTDSLVEDVHFKSSYASATDLGHKAFTVSLSDIAAMGGKPLYAFLALSIPSHYDSKWIHDFEKSAHEVLSKHKVHLLGGDTTRSPNRLYMNTSIIGVAEHSKIKTRDKAQIGDFICVTGELGNAHAGLEVLQQIEVNSSITDNFSYEGPFKKLVTSHLRPKAKLEEAQWLANFPDVHAMMDLSDGLEVDLHKLTKASGCGAQIVTSTIPLSKQFKTCSSQYGFSKHTAITGGEDYQLLLTINPEKFLNIEKQFYSKFKTKLTHIGHITQKSKIEFLNSHKNRFTLQTKAFQHFNPNLSP